MILVLLGTQNNDFHRLLCEIEKNIDNGIIKQEVVVQAGFTKYHSEKMRIFNLIPQNDLNKLVEKASLIVCTKDSYLKKLRMLEKIKQKGIFVLNTTKDINEVLAMMSSHDKKILRDRNVKMFIIIRKELHR